MTRLRRIALGAGLLLSIPALPLSAVALAAGALYWSFASVDAALLSDSVEETTARFGTFQEGELLKTRRVDGLGHTILSLAGRAFTPLEPLRDTQLHAIAYKSDGLVVTGVMMTPEAPGRYPCIIYNRGGNRDFGRINTRQASYFMGPYAADGYVVIASNYRGNNGSEGTEEFGGSDVNDVLNLVAALEQVPSADTSRIGVLGHSRGGMMTYLALQQEGIFDAAVVVAGSADLLHRTEDRPDMETYVYAELIPDYHADREAHLRERSVVWWPERLSRVPLLLLHGTSDDRVSYEEVEHLAERLDALAFPYQLVTFEGGSHSLRESRREVWETVSRWFAAHLRDQRPLGDIPRRVTLPRVLP